MNTNLMSDEHIKLNDLQAQQVAELFNILGDASRVKIIAALLKDH